jgi:hypothetical protein
MQRTSARREHDSTQISHSRRKLDATSLIRDLSERVARLERAFANTVAPLDLAASEIPATERKKPGPKAIHFQMLLSDRDTLVQMLESYWPEIEPLCWPRPKPKPLSLVFEAITNQQGSWYARASKHLVEHIDKLVDFLSTDRFRRDPRQIANAFAGFPAIGIWRSLKLCQSNPCNHHIGNRAIKAYIHRKHPDLFRDLDADYSLPNFASALRTFRTKDQKLSAFRADDLYQCWEQSKPNYTAIGINLTKPPRRIPS